MYKEVLRSIEDASLFPVMAIVLFMVFFLVLLIYVIRMDKKQVKQLSAMPLDENPKAVHAQPFTLNGTSS